MPRGESFKPSGKALPHKSSERDIRPPQKKEIYRAKIERKPSSQDPRSPARPVQNRPASRPKKPSPAEIKRARDARERKTERRKRKSKRFFASVLLFLTFYLLIIALPLGIFFISRMISTSSDALYSVSIKISNRKEINLDNRDTNLSGGIYIPFSALEKLRDRSLLGDGENFTLAIRENGDVINLKVGSSSADVNGTPVRLNAPVLIRKGELMLPYELVYGCMEGFECIKNDEDKTLVIKRSEGKDGFFPCRFAPVPEIPESDVFGEDSEDKPENSRAE